MLQNPLDGSTTQCNKCFTSRHHYHYDMEITHTHTHTYQSVHFQKTKAEILNPGELMSLVTFDHC